MSDATSATASDTLDPFLSPKRGSAEVYMIRHADALPGPDEVIEGGYDVQSLSELGRKQGDALGERLRDAGLTAVYSSPIGRARETAGYVARAAGLEVQIEDDLREVELGHIGPDAQEALTADEITIALRKRLHEIAVIIGTTGRWSAIAGSEPSAALRARVTGVIDRLAARHPGQRIAAVSHGGTINAFFAAILGLELDYFFPAVNTSISVARVKAPRHVVLALNDINHLRERALLEDG
jgi:probable phosphoglycerate mutase